MQGLLGVMVLGGFARWLLVESWLAWKEEVGAVLAEELREDILRSLEEDPDAAHASQSLLSESIERVARSRSSSRVQGLRHLGISSPSSRIKALRSVAPRVVQDIERDDRVSKSTVVVDEDVMNTWKIAPSRFRSASTKRSR
jgi:hypothetical protein